MPFRKIKISGPGLLSGLKSLFVHDNEIRDIQYWQDKILSAILGIFSIFGLFAYVPSVYMAVLNDLWAVVVVDTLAYGSVLLICFLHNLSFRFKAFYILFCLYFIGVSMLFLIDADYSLMWFFAVPVMAAILLGLRISVIALLVNVITFVVSAYLINEGIVKWSNVEENLVNGWIILGVNFIFLNFIISVGISIVVEQLKYTLDKVISAHQLLDEKHNNLVSEIGHRIEAEEEKDRLNVKLQQSQKMEAIGMMAGGVAHDLNNILSGIINYPELMLMKLPQDSEYRKPLTAIMNSGNRAAEIVSDLLTVARGVASEKQVYSLNEIVKEYMDSPELNTLKQNYPAIKFKLSLDDNVKNILCSHVHVFKSLMNLVLNSVESIDAEGVISIRTYSLTMSGDSEEIQKYSVLEVCDSGKGISEADINHIFEPFYTRKVMGRSGTGLGLTIVWNAVHDHGGHVDVNSDLSGTCFRMSFPVTDDPVQSDQDSCELDDIKGNGEVVLVVDDEELQRDVASNILRSLNYQVFQVSSGEAAVDFLKKVAADVVLLDMLMPPGIDGLETYRRIIQFNPHQKTIIASGYAESEAVKEAQNLGAGEFLAKPYSRVQLGQAMKQKLSESLQK